MVAMDSHRNESPGDEKVLATLMQINDPSNVMQESLPSYREIPPTPQLLGNVKERFLQMHDQNEEDMDEDDIRTRRYWKRWGNRAAKDLVKTIEKERLQKSIRRRELVYSARVKEPVYRKDDIDSDSSSDTAISLLTTSSMAMDGVTFAQTQKRKKKKAKEEDSKIDWSKYSTRRVGLIDKLARADASALSTLVYGGETALNPHGHPSFLDVLPEEERNLLTQCAYRRGIHGSRKSHSTENVLTIWRKRPTTAKRPNTRSSDVPSPIKSDYLPSRGCTPTPSEIGQAVRKMQRSDSAIITKCAPDDSRKGSAVSRDSRSKSIVSNSVPESVKKYMEGVKGLPDFEGVFSKRVRQRIRRTVSALERKVGDGDELDTIAEIPGEVGRYTADDYSRIPKYPQRVLITPQLASVIKKDIKLRMGRPRCHQIKTHDLNYFNSQNPPVDRSHRNLLVFNWLASISEEEFELHEAPDIVDLEGELAEYKNVLKHGDVMSREPTTLSHISGGMSDGASAFTMSVFSGDEQVSPNASDDEDTRTEGERMSPGMSYLSSSKPDTCRT